MDTLAQVSPWIIDAGQLVDLLRVTLQCPLGSDFDSATQPEAASTRFAVAARGQLLAAERGCDTSLRGGHVMCKARSFVCRGQSGSREREHK